MVNGLLMKLEDHNCWTIAEAAATPATNRDSNPKNDLGTAVKDGGERQGSGVFRTYPVLCSMRWQGGIAQVVGTGMPR